MSSLPQMHPCQFPELGQAPPAPGTLSNALVGEEEEQKVKDWCIASGHDRSDFFERRLETADELRVEANALFKEARFDEAVTRYLGAIWHLDYDTTQQMDLMPPEQTKLDTRKLKAMSNTCAAFLKLAQEAEGLETSAPDEKAECFARWEKAPDGEGMVVDDPAARHREELAEAHKRDPDVIDFSVLSDSDDDRPEKRPVQRIKMPHRDRKIEYYRLVKTTADIGLKQIYRMGMNESEMEAKFYYRRGIAERERGFSEPAYAAFKKANELLPGDRDIRQCIVETKSVMQEDRAVAKQVWRGKLKAEEADTTSQGSLSWLKRLIGCARRRLAGTTPSDLHES